jgi:hypothetical protein
MRTIPRLQYLLRAALIALLTAPVCAPVAVAQRSVVEDKSTVQVQKRAPRTITRGPSQVATAKAATNGVLVVLTDPPAATVTIDGLVAGKSNAQGEFSRELRGGKDYTVKVSAGAEYVPITSKVTLAPRATEIVKAPLVSVSASKFGLVKIGPIVEGAKIYVDGAAQPWAKVAIDKEDNFMLVDGLAPGDHKLRVDHPDYVIVEKSFKNVAAGEEYVWVFKPEFATVPMTVTTDPGTSIYVDGEFKGDTPENGTLEVKDVRLGTREVKLVKDGFVEWKETRTFEYGKPVAVANKLVPLPTSAEFSDDFDINMSKWVVPAGWTSQGGRLVISNCQTLGIAKNITYRDFEMAFHLRLEDGRGAAWAVRAKNTNDYYLFYLSGPKGLFPNRFNTYIVKDGKFDPQTPDQSVVVIAQLTPKGEYQVIIDGKKDVIEHSITPSATGQPEPLGVFQDPNKTYLYGGIGFRNVGPEQFSVDELFVQPR